MTTGSYVYGMFFVQSLPLPDVLGQGYHMMWLQLIDLDTSLIQ